MQIICRIQEQLPLQEREYDNRQTGQREKFASMGFKLACGDESFYAEMVQEQARKQPQLDKQYYHVANVRLRERSWQDTSGQIHHQTDVQLLSIAPL